MEAVPLEIHQTLRFAKRLIFMAKAGKIERIVAERAKQILANLQANPLHEEAECKRTRHGELRLNDCRKYDLSCGYRLIAIKKEKRLIFTYVGSHDDCQRWIVNNRYYQNDIESVPVSLHEQPPSEALFEDEVDLDKHEEQMLVEIDERMLREIFSGLCKNG